MSFVQPSGWNDYLFPGLSIGMGANAPTIATFRDNIQALQFSGTGGQTDQGFFSLHILHDYRSGTKIFPHIHWGHIIESPSGDVVWQLDYTLAKGHSGGSFPAATTIELQQTAGGQYDHHVIETSTANAIGPDNLEPDTVILFRIYRDPAHASDDFENEAFLFFVDLHFQSDMTLTNEKVRPFTKRMKTGEISV